MSARLNSKKYKQGMQRLYDCEAIINKHNSEIAKTLDEISKRIDICLVKFPMLSERSNDTPSYYVRDRIETAIQTQSEILLRDSDIIARYENQPRLAVTGNPLAHIEDSLVRGLFLGELRAAVISFKSRLYVYDNLQSANSCYGDYSIFLNRIIERVETFGKLEGKCEIEIREIEGVSVSLY